MLDRRRGRTGDEWRQMTEEALLLGREQIVAPGNRISKCSLAVGEVRRATGKHAQALSQARLQRRKRQMTEPCGSQLESEGQAIQPSTDLGDMRRIGISHDKVALRSSRVARTSAPHRTHD